MTAQDASASSPPDGRGSATRGADRRSRPSLLLGTLLAVALLVGLLVAVGPGAALAPLAGADLGLLALAVLAAVASLGCRHLAYALLCRRADASPLGRRFHLYLLVAGVPRWVVPFGYVGGPVINATYLARGLGARFEATAAALAVSELLALVASGLVLTVGFLLVLASGGTAPSGPLLGVGLAFVTLTVGAGFLFVLAGNGAVTTAATGGHRRLLVVLDRFAVTRALAAGAGRLLGDRVHRFTTSIATVATDRRTVAAAFLANAVAWLFGILPLYLAARAVGLPVPIGVVMVTVPLAAGAGAVPVPAGLGAIEVAYTALLVSLAGAAPATAAAATLLFRLSTMGMELLVGGLASVYVIVSRR